MSDNNGFRGVTRSNTMWSRVKAALLPTTAALVFGAAVGFSAAGTAHTVQGQSAVDQVTQELHDVYAKDNPSVVTLNVRMPASASGFNGFNAPNQGQYQYAAGSGFVYDTNGDIVT